VLKVLKFLLHTLFTQTLLYASLFAIVSSSCEEMCADDITWHLRKTKLF